MELESLQNASLAGKLASMDYPKLENLTALSEDAAVALADSEGDLELNGLRELSADVAEALARHKGDVCSSTKGSWAKECSKLSLNGLTELSDEVAEALSKHKGDLYLGGLAGLSDNAAEALAKHKGQINRENPGKWLKSIREGLAIK